LLYLNHRHLSNIGCLKVRTAALFASLVPLMATGKKEKKH
jgi:hypothetical protein